MAMGSYHGRTRGLPDRHEGALAGRWEGLVKPACVSDNPAPATRDPPLCPLRRRAYMPSRADHRTPSSLLLKSSTSRAMRARVERSSGSERRTPLRSLGSTASPTARNRWARSFRVFRKGSVAFRRMWTRHQEGLPEAPPRVGDPPGHGSVSSSRPAFLRRVCTALGHHSWRGLDRCDADIGVGVSHQLCEGGRCDARPERQNASGNLPNQEARMVPASLMVPSASARSAS